MISTLIIDDDQRCRIDLRRKLNAIDRVNVIGEADGVEGGYKAVIEHNPSLLFIDVDLADGSAFSLLKRFGTGTLPFHAVLLHDNGKYALEAFKYRVFDYLIKPVGQAELLSTVERLQRKINLSDERLIRAGDGERITLRTLHDVYVVPLISIVRCESKNNATIFYFSDGSKPIQVSKTLKEFEQRLSGCGFIRCHQSHLINVEHLIKTRKYPLPIALMDDGTEVPISIRKMRTMS